MKVRYEEEATINMGHYESRKVRVGVEFDSSEFEEDLTPDQMHAEARMSACLALKIRLDQIKGLADSQSHIK